MLLIQNQQGVNQIKVISSINKRNFTTTKVTNSINKRNFSTTRRLNMDPSVLTNMDIDMLLQTEIHASEFIRLQNELKLFLTQTQNLISDAKSTVLTIHNAILSPDLNQYSPNKLVHLLHKQYILKNTALMNHYISQAKYNELLDIVYWSEDIKLKFPPSTHDLNIETTKHLESYFDSFRSMKTAFQNSNLQGDATTRLIKSTLPKFYADHFFSVRR